MPCRGGAPSYRKRSTPRPTRPREPRRKPDSCVLCPGCTALGDACLLGGERFSLGVGGGSVMMIIVTILRLLSMTTMICVRTVSIISSGIITIIVDVLTTSIGIVFNERLEKCPHPSRKRSHAGSEIRFEGLSRRRIFKKLG